MNYEDDLAAAIAESSEYERKRKQDDEELNFAMLISAREYEEAEKKRREQQYRILEIEKNPHEDKRILGSENLFSDQRRMEVGRLLVEQEMKIKRAETILEGEWKRKGTEIFREEEQEKNGREMEINCVEQERIRLLDESRQVEQERQERIARETERLREIERRRREAERLQVEQERVAREAELHRLEQERVAREAERLREIERRRREAERKMLDELPRSLPVPIPAPFNGEGGMTLQPQQGVPQNAMSDQLAQMNLPIGYDYEEAMREAMEMSLRAPPPRATLTHIEMWERNATQTSRPRIFLEVPGDMGGLIVGSKGKHTQKIALEVGGNCKINFHRRVKGSKDSPACIIIEADTKEATDAAEIAVGLRIANLFFDAKDTGSSREQQTSRVSNVSTVFHI